MFAVARRARVGNAVQVGPQVFDPFKFQSIERIGAQPERKGLTVPVRRIAGIQPDEPGERLVGGCPGRRIGF
jgi:hypothetical protein